MAWTLQDGDYTRPLGDSEYALFPGSQRGGLGDMFLHLAFRASAQLLNSDRVASAWALIRARHPLLAAKVRLPSEGDHPSFVFTPPNDIHDALTLAKVSLGYSTAPKRELIKQCMDGSRVLSNDQLSFMTISTPNLDGKRLEDDNEITDFELVICAPHFVGDGTSLHQTAQEFLVILSKLDTDATSELAALLKATSHWIGVLPIAAETHLRNTIYGYGSDAKLASDTKKNARLRRATAQVNYDLNQRREIGGHTFSREQQAPQRTALIERALSPEQTRAVLVLCKSHGMSISHALFVLCNIAWARTGAKRKAQKQGNEYEHLPILMYTALNLRPYLSPTLVSNPTPTQEQETSYWFLALTYLNIILPSFFPASASKHDTQVAKTFWHRAQSAKAQTARGVRSPFLPARALIMAEGRAARAHPSPASPAPIIAPPTDPSPSPPTPAVPSAALLGLSLIGNLDTTYTQASYAPNSKIELQTVTTASRQRPGGLLFLAHTFGGRLWLHLCWDAEGFACEDVNGKSVVEEWWEALGDGVFEFLVGGEERGWDVDARVL